MGEKRRALKVLERKCEGKRLITRRKGRFKDNDKMEPNIKESVRLWT
jgi:hypothetical protein